MIISQSLDINEDFEKEKSKTDNILKDTKESNVDNNEIKTKKDSNIDKISENLASNEKKENRVITKEELIKEQFHKKMWDVWEKYLSGDPINKNRELIRFPCIHNQAP
ncbi:hypothetical protein BCR36DRAFT_282007 [Piromyces finnis]|uniref:Uncharacterized protein n=1 Tax=Piromyces finnis TaxID=1754191 RepID=A0A1Y1VFW8_9FUNG|nr:hypothetical protein BCR36DRAFT_282007 [Piromyces finnis]|eukprot:ORX55298.1 hypothetical protein BCR36DRAFT_282007 [Piromyces finnis]